jgi:hypothetical protein
MPRKFVNSFENFAKLLIRLLEKLIRCCGRFFGCQFYNEMTRNYLYQINIITVRDLMIYFMT